MADVVAAVGTYFHALKRDSISLSALQRSPYLSLIELGRTEGVVLEGRRALEVLLRRGVQGVVHADVRFEPLVQRTSGRPLRSCWGSTWRESVDEIVLEVVAHYADYLSIIILIYLF